MEAGLSNDDAPMRTVESCVLALSLELAHKTFSSEKALRAADMFAARFGLGPAGSDRTLAGIGQHYEITRQRVLQIVKKMEGRLGEIDRESYRAVFDWARSHLNIGLSLHARSAQDGMQDWLGVSLTLRDAQRFYRSCFQWDFLGMATVGRSKADSSPKGAPEPLPSRAEWLVPIAHEDRLIIHRAIKSMLENSGAVNITSILENCQARGQRAFDPRAIDFLLQHRPGIQPVEGQEGWMWFPQSQRNHFLVVATKVILAARKPVSLPALQHAARCANRNLARIRDNLAIKVDLPEGVARHLLRSQTFLRETPMGWSVHGQAPEVFATSEWALVRAAWALGPASFSNLIEYAVTHYGASRGACSLALLYSGIFTKIDSQRVIVGSLYDTSSYQRTHDKNTAEALSS